MVPRRRGYAVLPHFGAKPDVDSRLVKPDPGAHCCFSWDALNLESLFSLPHKLLLPIPHHSPESSRVEFPICLQNWSFLPLNTQLKC